LCEEGLGLSSVILAGAYHQQIIIFCFLRIWKLPHVAFAVVSCYSVDEAIMSPL